MTNFSHTEVILSIHKVCNLAYVEGLNGDARGLAPSPFMPGGVFVSHCSYVCFIWTVTMPGL